MLSKDATVPGARVVVNQVIKDGIPGNMRIPGTSNILTHLTVHLHDTSLGGGKIPINSGDVLEILAKPRKRDGINLVEVKTPCGNQGVVFWCELRASCTHI